MTVLCLFQHKHKGHQKRLVAAPFQQARRGAFLIKCRCPCCRRLWMWKVCTGAEHKCAASWKKNPPQVIKYKDLWPRKSLSCKMCESILGKYHVPFYSCVGICCWPRSETGPGEMGCWSDLIQLYVMFLWSFPKSGNSITQNIEPG